MTGVFHLPNQGAPERKPIKKLRVFTKMSPERTVLKKDQAEEERELLRFLLQKEGLGSGPWEIASAETQEHVPLSWAQKRLWFLDRLQPGSDFYNVVVVCELHGDLKVPASGAEFVGDYSAARGFANADCGRGRRAGAES